MTAQIVKAVLRKVGQWIGLRAEERRSISGHSARVGAAQDLLALNKDLLSVMHAADGETLDIGRTWSGPADTGRCSPRSLEEEPGAMLRLVDQFSIRLAEATSPY